MLALQEELESVREEAQRSREREARRTQQDEEELQILRERCERLEEERTSAVRPTAFRILFPPSNSSIARRRSC
jgi:hypothetical protein